ncbi:MAG: division/cell wall cluster transcriptional repressor MraZ [Tepidiformaceae bacterium]
MFLGRYTQQLDDKKRLAIPARYRDQFDSPAFLTASPDGCIAVYTKDGYEKAAEEVLAESGKTRPGRDSRRDFFTDTRDIKPDPQGRLTLPAFLLDHAGLSKEVVVAGVGEWFEYWDAARWAARNQPPAENETPTETGG